MAKKFVRGITDIKNIEHQDFDTNNVNDLLSDGKHNYIHRKKSDGSEEYHNLTNNLKTIQSDDTDLVSVTNYNNTTNSATIRPKHDAQKEQVLESTNETILIEHGENGTDETTTVDVNPAEVLQHENLLTSYGISKSKSGNNTTLGLEYTAVAEHFDLNTLENGNVRTWKALNAPINNHWFFVSSCKSALGTFQEAFTLVDNDYRFYKRFYNGSTWSEWREQVTDKSIIDNLLTQKQNTLTSNSSIGVDGTVLMQLYSYEMSYMVTSAVKEGSLNTYAKTVKKDTNLTAEPKLEYHFTAELKAGKTSITIPLNNNDTTYFSYILIKYGETSGSTQTAMINGLLFTLNGSQLTVSRDTSTYNQVVSFSDIIDPSQDTTQ